ASPDELRDNLEGYLFQVECNHPNQARELLDEMDWTYEVSIHGVLLHVIADRASRIKDIQKLLRKADIVITRIEESVPSLEDVFIAFIEEKRKLADA
ncbi:MAG: DUF4162 domain-containing protein, partial [Anaerolineales bacterium]